MADHIGPVNVRGTDHLDPSVLPERWVDLKGDGSEYAHRLASTLVDLNGLPLGSAASPLRANHADVTASGTLTAAWNGTGSPPAGSQVAIATNGLAAVGVGITGTWVATLQFEGSVDATNWFSVVAVPYGGGQGATSVTANGNWRIHSAGLQQVRVRCSAFTSGTATVALEAANGSAWTGTDASGNLNAGLATLIAGEDLTNNLLRVEERYSYAAISTAVTTVVKSGAGFVHAINVLGGTLGAITVYDNTSASGTTIWPTFTPLAAQPWIIDASFGTGLTVVTAAATVIQVSYR